MSVVFTFLCTTNQVKTLIFDKAFEFHKNLAAKSKIGFDKLDKDQVLNLLQMETSAQE